ncbi:MAG: hypothetical protein IPF64_13285 [Flavobacteriales bacterium]|nr:hypothetical protein [Flavobacteriales bacterium]
MPIQKKAAAAVKKAKEANPLLPKRPAATKRVLKTTTKKVKSHPGQTDAKGPAHDRQGSEMERKSMRIRTARCPTKGRHAATRIRRRAAASSRSAARSRVLGTAGTPCGIWVP